MFIFSSSADTDMKQNQWSDEVFSQRQKHNNKLTVVLLQCCFVCFPKESDVSDADADEILKKALV